METETEVEPIEEEYDERLEGIYVVKEGGAIHWPDRKLRGTEGYVVRGDDPFMKQYFKGIGIPAMLIRDDDAIPVPASEWPNQYRAQAGRKYLTKAEADDQDRAQKAAEERALRKLEEEEELESRVESEVPDVDED